MIYNPFKKRIPKEDNDLKKALEQGLITEEEFLRLKYKRVENELKDYLLRNKSKK